MKVLLFQIVFLGAVLSLLGSCAGPPATIRHHPFDVIEGESEEDRLHRLLDRAVREPDQPDYAKVIGGFVEMWSSLELGQSHLVRSSKEGAVTYRVSFANQRLGCFRPDYFEQILSAASLEVDKLPHYRKSGVGAPLVAVRENSARERIERFYPPEAITRPLTAIIEPGPRRNGIREVRVSLLCPLTHSRARMGGRSQELAADYTAPWATFLSRTEALSRRSILDALTSQPERAPQLYLMEPYNPRKEPLLMIHGLFSTPLAWAELSNEMWADDTIRNRYQVWHYLYNTSAPPLYSARLLRTQLRELKALLDPSGQHHAWKNLTVIAHSMGGIVAKCLVTRPGDAYWEAAFNVSHEELKLSPKDRASLNEAFEWQPIPSVQRIVFVAVPHRGSDYADNFLGLIGRALTTVPNTFESFYQRISKDNPGVFKPVYADLGEGRMNSISVLSPQQPTLKILSRLPFAYPIRKHSIVGDRGREGALAESSDGIVPYWSSHLDDVVSEKVLPAEHDVYRTPAAVEEIKRILKLP